MGRLVAFVGAAPASAFCGAAVGRPSLSLRASRTLVCSPSRRPKAPRMMATEDVGQWKKSDKSKGNSSSSTATDVVDEKAAAAGFKVDATAEAAAAESDAPVTEFQPPSLNTTIFSDFVDDFDSKLQSVKQKVADVDVQQIQGESSASLKALADNFLAGDWLNRGELWGAVQLAFVYMMVKESNLDNVVSFIVGPVVLISGAILSVKGAWDLGRKQISLWPAPVPDGTLKTKGIYGVIRHPLYSGLLLSSLGYASATSSAERFALTFALAYVLRKKIDVEEKFLVESYGDEYEDYMEDVPYKIIPKVF
ncbi:hypothetical protein BU14_0382s0003 [Porphyra umbilicalis]|uniref:Protein-S-isoprenylcysteine O-methyltransferase n=1 Tax=Porphyra umbilicalis TaxID=2786 RepID=A0A1X6NWT9_PORUM|nr:hypothetical protein BU14_0382s0003 [Porphyra umbilicalis]|eukprot:OSX73042.1 hypothetical protein BU14_0382s0003 [Porphyra umbilicalis]